MNTVKKEQKVTDKNLFEELFEITPEGVALLDIGTLKFIKCNSNASKLLKYSAADIIGMSLEGISPEFQPDGCKSNEKFMEMVLQAVHRRKSVFEWLMKNKVGKQFMAEVRLVSLLRIGKPWIYFSFVDITQTKRQEKKMREQNTDLHEMAFL